MGRNYQRIILFFSAFLLPWYFTVLLALIGLFLFEDFYEIIFVGLLFDSLYGTSLYYTLIATVLFIISIFIRKKFKFFVNK